MVRRIPTGMASMQIVDKNGKASNEFARLVNHIVTPRRINIGAYELKTIASGVIDITDIDTSYFFIETESAAASDDLVTITGGNRGDIIFLFAYNNTHTVVLKHDTGNIIVNGMADFSLDAGRDLAMLVYDGSYWRANGWNLGV